MEIFKENTSEFLNPKESEIILNGKNGESFKLKLYKFSVKLSALPDATHLDADIKKLLEYLEYIERFIKMRIIIDDFEDHSKRRLFKDELDRGSLEAFRDNALVGNNISAIITIFYTLHLILGDSSLSNNLKRYLYQLENEAHKIEEEYRKLYNAEPEADTEEKINFVFSLKARLIQIRREILELAFNKV